MKSPTHFSKNLLTIGLLCLLGLTACTTSTKNKRPTTSKPYDIIWGNPSIGGKLFIKLSVIQITTEIPGYWIELNKDRIGKSPIKIGVYTTVDRKLPNTIRVEAKPPQEFEKKAAADNPDNYLPEASEYLWSSDILPKNLHLNTPINSRKRLGEWMAMRAQTGQVGVGGLNSPPLTTSTGAGRQVDGDFEGWDGETVVVFTNGEVWKQTDFHYEYHYALQPKAVVFKDGLRFKILIEGTRKAVEAERVR